MLDQATDELLAETGNNMPKENAWQFLVDNIYEDDTLLKDVKKQRTELRRKMQRAKDDYNLRVRLKQEEKAR